MLEKGQKFGDLTIVNFLGRKNKKKIYNCVCDCGNYREVRQTNLVNNITTNCGCKNFIYKKHKNQKYDPITASFRAKASNYKSLAKARNIKFELSIEETCDLLKGNCFYCNSFPSNNYNVRKSNRINKKNKIQYAADNADNYDILYNGIDRIDNTKGYNTKNTVTCCTQCNTAKLDKSLNDFKQWVEKIYNNLILNKK